MSTFSRSSSLVVSSFTSLSVAFWYLSRNSATCFVNSVNNDGDDYDDGNDGDDGDDGDDGNSNDNDGNDGNDDDDEALMIPMKFLLISSVSLS